MKFYVACVLLALFGAIYRGEAVTFCVGFTVGFVWWVFISPAREGQD